MTVSKQGRAKRRAHRQFLINHLTILGWEPAHRYLASTATAHSQIRVGLVHRQSRLAVYVVAGGGYGFEADMDPAHWIELPWAEIRRAQFDRLRNELSMRGWA